MTVIPKVILIYKLRIYNIGDEGPFDTIYCRPENLHYWVEDIMLSSYLK